MTETTNLACHCGQVQIVLDRQPILSAECYCNSCRSAAQRLQTLPGSHQILNANGGTPFVLYRKDRVRFVKGSELFREFRLTDKSPTRRVIAGCCHTPLFLEFQSGHWLSIYAQLWPQGTCPPPELRAMTSDLPDASILPNDLPNARRQNVRFFRKLLGAWVAMGFKVPEIEVNGKVTV